MEGGGNNSINHTSGALNLGGSEAAGTLQLHQQNALAGNMNVASADLTEVVINHQPQADSSSYTLAAEDGSGGSFSGPFEVQGSSSGHEHHAASNRIAQEATAENARQQEVLDSLFQLQPILPTFYNEEDSLSSPESPSYSPPTSPTSTHSRRLLQLWTQTTLQDAVHSTTLANTGEMEESDQEEDLMDDEDVDSDEDINYVEDADREAYVADPSMGEPVELNRDDDLSQPFVPRPPDAPQRVQVISQVIDALSNAYTSGIVSPEEIRFIRRTNLYYMPEVMLSENGNARVNVEDMSYEQLEELRERIGTVLAAMRERAITSHVTHRKFRSPNIEPPTESEESCCICLEEYADGDDIAKLKCRHEFHLGCIRQWIFQKNECPICRQSPIRI